MRALAGFVVLVVIGVVVAYLVITVRRTEIPQRQRLLALTREVQKLNFTVPKGSHFSFLIGTGGHQGGPESSILGTVAIRKGTDVISEVSFDSANLTPANWLSTVGLNAFILTKPLGPHPVELDRCFSPGATITVEGKCDRDPGGDATLWLSYLVKAADRSKP